MQMEPCSQCGDDVWGFVQQPSGTAAQAAGLPTWHAMVFPCEHLVWLPMPSGAETPGSEAVGGTDF